LLALGIEEITEDRPSGQGAEGQRAHELARVLGEAHGDPGTEASELAQQHGRLVGGDRAGHAEDQLATVQRHVLAVSPSSLTRYSTLAAAISSRAELVGFL